MPLKIQTTGLEQYAPGGAARIKVLTIGGPGAGKTRWASYFPKPIYADCERGLASVADRRVPFVNINTSQDMLDLLEHLKVECRKPADQRDYQTVVIDTLDAFQRKIKAEWMDKERKQVFTGWEAWGYLNSKMQLLLTRLLNLDMNVIVNVHYKDKTTKDDETGRETHELMLQLQGETADTAFNDFDLVGWMGTYFEAVEGQKVEKRGLTFKRTPDKPFLKDRLHVTPKWMEVRFDDEDYNQLFGAITARIDELEDGEVVGEIASVDPTAPPTPSGLVMAPGDTGSGALSPTPAREVPLSQLDKPTLAKRCRDLGVTTTVDGQPIKGNTLKSELIAALEAHQNQATPPPSAEPAAEEPAAPAVTPTEPEAPAQAEAVVEPEPTPPTQADVEADTGTPAVLEQVDEGKVDTATGELVDDATGIKNVEDVLGAEKVGEFAAPAQPEPTPQPEPDKPSAPVAALQRQQEAAAQSCEVCGTDLSKEDPNRVKLAWIKYRARLCSEHYAARKAGRR